MKRCSIALMLLCLTWLVPVHAANQGDVLWARTFDDPTDLQNSTGSGQIVASPERQGILFLSCTNSRSACTRSFPLPIEKLRGCYVMIGADVRAESVTAKPNSWNRIKLMTQVDLPSGPKWPQSEIPTGTFDWTRFSQRVFIPTNATAAILIVGLEQVAGCVWFDNVRVTFVKMPAQAPAASASVPIFRGHSEARLRGAMIAPNSLGKADLEVLGRDWGANLVRWQLIRYGVAAKDTSAEGYDRWLDEQLKQLDRGLAWAGELGVKVVVDLHSPPGGGATSSGYQAGIGGIWTNPKAQAQFVEVWKKIATRYKGDKRIWGYDLLNEPDDNNVAESCADWQELALRAGEAIRQIDAASTLIVEPPNWGSASGFAEFAPIPLTNVVYSFHMYNPIDFTHQGVFGPSAPVAYPGKIAGAEWNKGALERSMEPAISFAQRYRVHLYVGEFSAIRWAPGAERYLSDLIEIFEAHGWDWSYHAFREWDGWSLEHGAEKDNHVRSAQPNARQQVVLKWLKAPGK